MHVMIYPERRTVTDEQVRGWYTDRLCDDALKSARTRVGRDLTDLETEAVVQDTLACEADAPIATALAYLEDAGVATFRRAG